MTKSTQEQNKALVLLWEIPVGAVPIDLRITRADVVYRDKRNGRIYTSAVIVGGVVQAEAVINTPGWKWDCKYHVVFVPKCGAKQTSGRRIVNWGRFSTHWRGRKSARWSKVTSCQTLCTFAFRFPPSTRWLR